MREAAIYEKTRGGRGKGGKAGSGITGRGVRRVVEVRWLCVLSLSRRSLMVVPGKEEGGEGVLVSILIERYREV